MGEMVEFNIIKPPGELRADEEDRIVARKSVACPKFAVLYPFPIANLGHVDLTRDQGIPPRRGGMRPFQLG